MDTAVTPDRRSDGPRLPAPMVFLLALVVGPAALSGWLGGAAPATIDEQAAPLALAGAEGVGGGSDAVFAEVDGLRLVAPSPRLRFLGFHEASYRGALELQPVGRLDLNDNPDRYEPVGDRGMRAYTVLNGRGRSNAATSAADLVLPEDTEVRSPVDGVVRDVRRYRLYGRYDDVRLEIVPDEAPDLRVVMIHMTDVRVAAGDRVVAGRTPVAGAAVLFPFESQVDRYVGGRPLPHVHLEVKHGDADEPAEG